MRKRIRKILVTGGAGFIGSAFVRMLVKEGLHSKGTAYDIAVIDKLTYAGDLERLKEVKGRFTFHKVDISDKAKVESVVKKFKPEIIVNFAAETHVDRSIKDAAPFIKTNVIGTHVILDIIKKYSIPEFIHISTDEVYGDIQRGSFDEEAPLGPNSPYAASKAAADMLIRSYVRTYRIPAIIVRPSNNYGPWQYPEKLLPLSIFKLLSGKKIPIYAKGENIREWLYVEDCAKAIIAVLKSGKIGQIYNLGSGTEQKNIQVIKIMLKLMNSGMDSVSFVKDRPGHDFRYKLNSLKILRHTGWKPRIRFGVGINNTIKWYLKNKKWLFRKAGI